MRLLITGGGTGGHINPALAIAQYFKANEKNCRILYAGTPNGMEANLVKKAGFDFAPIKVMGFYRSFAPADILHNIKAVKAAITSKKRAKEILNDFKPDLVIGTGGYVSGPIVLQAAKYGIKTAIHEQNAFPGITNRMLSKEVDKVFLAVAEAEGRMDSKAEYEVVGNPVRENIIFKSKSEAKKNLKLDDKLTILSFGGSLGADTINKIGADIIKWNIGKNRVNHIHGYGRLGVTKFPEFLKERDIDVVKDENIRISEYIDNMDECMAAADLVICRAGAITISEIEATGKSSILIPSPNVTANHQYHNAMVLVNANAAMILEEKDYTSEKIIEMVESLCSDSKKLSELSANASSLAILDTAKRIHDSSIKLIR